MKKVFTWYFAIFAVLTVLILIMVPDPAEKSNTLGGLGIVAVVALFYVLKFLNSHWSGTIAEIKTKKVYQSDDDGHGESYDVNYAYVSLSNGKTKKVKSKPGWKVGDKLEKRRSEADIRVID